MQADVPQTLATYLFIGNIHFSLDLQEDTGKADRLTGVLKTMDLSNLKLDLGVLLT